MSENNMSIKNKQLSNGFKSVLNRSEMPVLAAVLILAITFTIVNPNFLSPFNLTTLSRSAAHYVFIALAQAMVIIVGGMNLSIGYIGALTIVISGHLMQNIGWAVMPAFSVGILVALFAGLINGILIVKLRLNAFIVTLATSFIYRGLVTGISEGFPYVDLPKSVTAIGRTQLFGIPLMVFMAIATLLILWFFFTYFVAGRKLLATGGNETAAKMAAVNTNNSIILANTLSGLFAGIAGMCAMSIGGSGQPSTGADWMLYSFAVAVIGGTSLKGGIINPVGIFIGSFLIVMIRNGLTMVQANYYFESTYLGLILLIAVSLTTVSTIFKEVKKRREFLKNRDLESNVE